MDVFETVKNLIVSELSVDESQITDKARFIEDLGADSLNMVELIMKLEETFEISIPDEEAGKLVTVGDAVDYLKTKLG